MLGNRGLKQIWGAVSEKRHYLALVNMAKLYPDFVENTKRYLTAGGSYPYTIKVRTPQGVISPTLYSHHDILTVNEIFCRLDYRADSDVKIVVDLGSNIGISALYFLTRNAASKCYLHEPDTRNIERLKVNLAGYADRFDLCEKAVSYESGRLEFGIEPTGRYGGIGVKTEKTITVDCLEINDVISNILDREEWIDILKVDTEGVEEKTVEAIRPEFLGRIKKIYLEYQPKHRLHPEMFSQRQYGTVCQLVNRSI